MNKKSLIHVKINPEELSPSKKGILLVEQNLIKVLQNLKRYQKSRLKELKLKSSFFRNLRETRLGISKVEATLPELELPRELRKIVSPIRIIGKNISEIKNSKSDNLEKQLIEIQDRLKKLEE